MRVLVALVTAAIVLSGCSSSSEGLQDTYQCPAEYGEGYKDAYLQAREEYQNQTGEALPDADRDCVPDQLEEEIGTDPQNATDYPSIEELQEFIGAEGEPGHEVTKGSGTIVAGVPTLALSQGGGAASVKEGATLLYAEYKWDTPAVDLNGALASPSSPTNAAGAQEYDHTNDGGLPGQPDNPHSLTITAPETGEWSVTMFANGAAANTAYDFAVTVFYGATEVPDGYTAFE